MKNKIITVVSTLFFVMGLIFFFDWITTKIASRVAEEPNCWEEKIAGFNEQTGNHAWYSDNFDCKDFKTCPDCKPFGDL